VFIRIILGIFYWPLAVLWSLFYGVFGGFVYKICATWEDFWMFVKEDHYDWQNHSDEAYKKYLKDQVEKGKIYKHELDFYFSRVANLFPEQPYPWANIIFIFLFSVGSIPFRCIAGMIEGPQVVMRDCKYFWREKVLKKDPQERYIELLNIQKKIDSREYDDDEWKSVFIHL
jgi:hypothetical protein